MMEIATELQAIRAQRGMTQAQMADALQISRPLLSRIEAGWTPPGPRFADLVVKRFSLSTDRRTRIYTAAWKARDQFKIEPTTDLGRIACGYLMQFAADVTDDQWQRTLAILIKESVSEEA